MTMELPGSVVQWQERLSEHLYIAERSLATAIFLSVKLQKPLFVDATGLLKSNSSNFISLRTRTRIEFGGVWRSVKLFAER